MVHGMNIILLGMYPWNFSSLNDSVRSMVFVMPENVIYLNPYAEQKTLSRHWQMRVEKSSNMDKPVTIANPPFSALPTRFGLHRLREKMSTKALVKDLVRWLGPNWRENSIVYVTASTLEQSYELVRTLHPKRLIFDILDDNLGFPGLSEEKRITLKSMFYEVSMNATKITAVSHYLVNQTEQWTGRSVDYLPNGVDVDRFRNNKWKTEPEDLQNIPHPRITFVGALTSWVDLPLIEQVALVCDSYQFVFVGPQMETSTDLVLLERLKRLPNVHLLGPKSFEEIPLYMHSSDVLLLPRTRDPYSLACDPLKIYEYLATGKPVVSTAHPSVERFADFVMIGNDAQGFVEGIEKALHRSENIARKQKRIVDDLSWEVRVNKLLEDFYPQK